MSLLLCHCMVLLLKLRSDICFTDFSVLIPESSVVAQLMISGWWWQHSNSSNNSSCSDRFLMSRTLDHSEGEAWTVEPPIACQGQGTGFPVICVITPVLSILCGHNENLSYVYYCFWYLCCSPFLISRVAQVRALATHLLSKIWGLEATIWNIYLRRKF